MKRPPADHCHMGRTPPDRADDLRVLAMLEMRSQGIRPGQIASSLGRSRRAVEKALKRVDRDLEGSER